MQQQQQLEIPHQLPQQQQQQQQPHQVQHIQFRQPLPPGIRPGMRIIHPSQIRPGQVKTTNLIFSNSVKDKQVVSG